MNIQNQTYFGKKIELSSFPHRSMKKPIPTIAKKIIPLHKLEIRRGYSCEINNKSELDQWAFVSLKEPKRAKRQTSYKEKFNQKCNKVDSDSLPQFLSTSKIFLRRYLKRKAKTNKMNNMYYSQKINTQISQQIKNKHQEEQNIDQNDNLFSDSNQIWHYLSPSKGIANVLKTYQWKQKIQKLKGYPQTEEDEESIKYYNIQKRGKSFKLEVLDKRIKTIKNSLSSYVNCDL